MLATEEISWQEIWCKHLGAMKSLILGPKRDHRKSANLPSFRRITLDILSGALWMSLGKGTLHIFLNTEHSQFLARATQGQISVGELFAFLILTRKGILPVFMLKIHTWNILWSITLNAYAVTWQWSPYPMRSFYWTAVLVSRGVLRMGLSRVFTHKSLVGHLSP